MTDDTVKNPSLASAAGRPADEWLSQPDAKAACTPREGMCCTVFRVRHGESWVETLNEPPSWELFQKRPAFFGNPMLFPFAYRIADNSFVYRGKRCAITPGREGFAMHGIVRDLPFRLGRRWEDDAGSHIEATWTQEAGAVDQQGAQVFPRYPFPFELTTTYTLLGKTLTNLYQVTNTGSEPLPMAPGIHPYFKLPLFADSEFSDYRLSSTSAYQGGMRLEPEGSAENLDLRQGRRLDAYFDAGASPRGAILVLHQQPDVDPQASPDDEGGATWRLVDTRHDLAIDVQASAGFPYVLDFSPPSREILSPVFSACHPRAFDMLTEGDSTAVVEVAPGQTWRAWVRITAG